MLRDNISKKAKSVYFTMYYNLIESRFDSVFIYPINLNYFDSSLAKAVEEIVLSQKITFSYEGIIAPTQWDSTKNLYPIPYGIVQDSSRFYRISTD